jgi:hypothetical protein
VLNARLEPNLEMAASERPTMDQLWETAQKRFRERTGQKLQVSPPKTLDDVRKEIESLSGDDGFKDNERKERFKESCMGALYCIKLLGGVAAQGASIVWCPPKH